MQTTNEKNIAIVCNMLAGAGRAVLMADKITTELKKRNIVHTLFKENWPGHFTGYTNIFIVGGDGTLNYFINHYHDILLPLVIFNAGTGNDFHWLLYGNMTFDELMLAALSKYPKPIDAGKCNEQYFINGVGIGFEGDVAKALTGKKKRPGKTSFLISILKKIFSYRSINYSIRSSERNITGKKLLVDICNGSQVGGGFHVAPEAKATDGLLDVIIAGNLSLLQRLKYLPVIEKGKHLHLPFIEHFRTTHILIESEDPMQYHLDGEYFEAQKLAIEILPAALNFRF